VGTALALAVAILKFFALSAAKWRTAEQTRHTIWKEVRMPDWSGCDVCTIIEILNQQLGDLGLSLPEADQELRFRDLEAELRSARTAPIEVRVLIAAEGLMKMGIVKDAIAIRDAIPRLLAPSNPSRSDLLQRANTVREQAGGN
jgi:hypothetical protein